MKRIRIPLDTKLILAYAWLALFIAGIIVFAKPASEMLNTMFPSYYEYARSHPRYQWGISILIFAYLCRWLAKDTCWYTIDELRWGKIKNKLESLYKSCRDLQDPEKDRLSRRFLGELMENEVKEIDRLIRNDPSDRWF